MKKFLVWLIVLTFVVSLAFSAIGCEKQATETTAAETTAAETTAAETTASAETTAPAEIDYKTLNAAAQKKEQYPGEPGKGKKIGFANFSSSFPFCASVQASIEEQAALAGFAKEDVFIMDNQFDATIALQNADIMLTKNPDVFVEFQIDAKVNAIIGKKFTDAGIGLLAVDVPIPGATFIGVDNFGSSYNVGLWLIDQIDKKYGGIDNVDLIIVGSAPKAGEVVYLRSIGTVTAFQDKYGKELTDKKLLIIENGSTAEDSKPVVAAVLADHPNAKKIVFSFLNDQTATGGIAAIEAVGNLNRDDLLIVSTGADESGQELLRNGKIDGDYAYFPERYGEIIVPAACALILGQSIPPDIYVTNEMITKENIDEWYPKK